MRTSKRKSKRREQTYVVRARWDDELRSWWTDGEDIPGLCCQAGTFEELTKAVFELGPQLLRANGIHIGLAIRIE